MRDLFLQETHAAVLVFDLRGFAALSAQLDPTLLGATLTRFYEHAEAAVTHGGGRLLKFLGDLAISVWITGQHGDAHGGFRQGALAAMRHAMAARAAWAAETQELGLPALSYSMAAAAGPLLAGHIGTPRLHAFDVLGAPASVAQRLAPIATLRDLDNLATADLFTGAPDANAVEAEPVDLGGQRYRVFRVLP